MVKTVNIYEAKTQLSALVEAAAAGEEVVIAKNGVAKARLVPLAVRARKRKPAGTMKLEWLAEDFDAPSREIERMFDGD